MRTREQQLDSYVNLAEVTEIELVVRKRLGAAAMGEHSGMVHGAGFDLVGSREWQAGDRLASIDWAQSSLRSFSPLVVREFEQASTASVTIVADVSKSTTCSLAGVPPAAMIARAIATVGLSAVFFQDAVGLVTFDDNWTSFGALPPRIGKSQVIHCLDAYQYRQHQRQLRRTDAISTTLAGFLPRVSMVPVLSDFLFDFDGKGAVLQELGRLNATHDVFIGLIDAAAAFELPAISAGWIEVFDVESGRRRVMSRRELRGLARRARAWQDEVVRMAHAVDLDVVRLPPDPGRFDLALMEFVAERRLRR